MSTTPDLMRNFGYLIKDIGRLYTKRFEDEAEHLGITLSEARVLTYLSRNSGLSQIQLAEFTGLEPMSLVRILDRMEADNWIERRSHPTDRRVRQLHLKAKAQPTIEQIVKLSTQMQAQSLVGLKAEERAALVDLLLRVHQQLVQIVSTPTGKLVQRASGVTRAPRKQTDRRGVAAARLIPPPSRTAQAGKAGKTRRASR